jgi:hypothetical protein
MSTDRRGRLVAAALCAVGGLVLVVVAGRPWVVQHIPRPPLPERTVALTGSRLAGLPRALGYVALAGTLALVATRGWARVAVGWLLAAAGAGAVVATLTAGAGVDGARTGWPFVAAAGAALVVAGGLLAALRGRRWAAMSARYDAPAARARVPADPHVAQWDALDAGDDPTDPAARG